MHLRRRPSRLVVIAGVAVGAIIACTDVGTDPATPVAIEFNAPALALVYDDSATGADSSALRDENGQIAPLRSYVFNSRGDTIRNATLVYSIKDTTASVDPSSGIVRLKHDTVTLLRAFTTIGSLQSAVVQVPVTPRPNEVRRAADSIATFVLPRGTQNGLPQLPPPANVVVLHHARATADSAERADSLVRLYRVSFEIERQPSVLGTVAELIDDQATAQLSTIDTTTSAGVAGRRVRIHRNAVITGLDSVVVRAHVTYAGHAVQDSAARVVIRFCVADSTTTTSCAP